MKNVRIIEKGRNCRTKNNNEETILSEFDIDSETMEEHQEELLLFMMHHDSEGKLHHD